MNSTLSEAPTFRSWEKVAVILPAAALVVSACTSSNQSATHENSFTSPQPLPSSQPFSNSNPNSSVSVSTELPSSSASSQNCDLKHPPVHAGRWFNRDNASDVLSQWTTLHKAVVLAKTGGTGDKVSASDVGNSLVIVEHTLADPSYAAVTESQLQQYEANPQATVPDLQTVETQIDSGKYPTSDTDPKAIKCFNADGSRQLNNAADINNALDSGLTKRLGITTRALYDGVKAQIQILRSRYGF